MDLFFDWFKDPGTQGMLVLLGTVCMFIAAVVAIYFGKKSLTKRDGDSTSERIAGASG